MRLLLLLLLLPAIGRAQVNVRVINETKLYVVVYYMRINQCVILDPGGSDSFTTDSLYNEEDMKLMWSTKDIRLERTTNNLEGIEQRYKHAKLILNSFVIIHVSRRPMDKKWQTKYLVMPDRRKQL